MNLFQKVKDYVASDAIPATKSEFEKVVKDFYESGQPYRFVKVKYRNKEYILGVINWGNDKIVDVEAFMANKGTTKFFNLWGEVVNENKNLRKKFLYIEGDIFIDAYIQAMNYFTGKSIMLSTKYKTENNLIEVDGEVENGAMTISA